MRKNSLDIGLLFLVSAYPQSTNTLIGEFYSDNIDENSRSYSYWQKLEDDLYHWKDTYEENQDSPQAVWDDCYAAIASANNALNAIENLGNPATLNPQKGMSRLCTFHTGHYFLSGLQLGYSRKGIRYHLYGDTSNNCLSTL